MYARGEGRRVLGSWFTAERRPKNKARKGDGLEIGIGPSNTPLHKAVQFVIASNNMAKTVFLKDAKPRHSSRLYC